MCAAGSEPLVQLSDVVRIYGTGPTAVRAVSGVSLTLAKGSLTALKGRSGSGKTTLLNLIGGLDRPTAGSISLRGQRLEQLSEPELTRLRRSEIGFVFQSFGLMPLLSARENVELPLRIAGMPAAERRKRSGRWLAYVGLSDRINHRPFELSGGEQQRVAIARALAAEPLLLLADEPTSGLDTATGFRVLELFRQVVAETGTTVCLTTHDPAILELADTVFELVDGELVVKE